MSFDSAPMDQRVRTRRRRPGAGVGDADEHGSAGAEATEDVAMSRHDSEESDASEDYSDSDQGEIYAEQGSSPDVFALMVGGRRYRTRKVGYSRVRALTWDTPEHAGESCAPEFVDEIMSTTFECPVDFVKFVIGKGGETKAKIERETGAKLEIPQQKQVASTSMDAQPELSISVEAPSSEALDSAIARLEMAMLSAREALPPTHFISLPLIPSPGHHDRLRRTGLQALQRVCKDTVRIASEAGSRGFHPSCVATPACMHLTLVALKLYSPREVTRAVASIERAVSEATALRAKPDGEDGSPSGARSEIALHGLEYMNDDPEFVHILYMSLLPDAAKTSLQSWATALLETLMEDEVLSHEEASRQWLLDPASGDLGGAGEEPGSGAVKLHATLVNTKHRRQPRGEAKGERQALDASALLKQLGDDSDTWKVHGTGKSADRSPGLRLMLTELHLSKMKGARRKPDGYWQAERIWEMSPETFC